MQENDLGGCSGRKSKRTPVRITPINCHVFKETGTRRKLVEAASRSKWRGAFPMDDALTLAHRVCKFGSMSAGVIARTRLQWVEVSIFVGTVFSVNPGLQPFAASWA